MSAALQEALAAVDGANHSAAAMSATMTMSATAAGPQFDPARLEALLNATFAAAGEGGTGLMRGVMDHSQLGHQCDALMGQVVVMGVLWDSSSTPMFHGGALQQKNGEAVIHMSQRFRGIPDVVDYDASDSTDVVLEPVLVRGDNHGTVVSLQSAVAWLIDRHARVSERCKQLLKRVQESGAGRPAAAAAASSAGLGATYIASHAHEIARLENEKAALQRQLDAALRARSTASAAPAASATSAPQVDVSALHQQIAELRADITTLTRERDQAQFTLNDERGKMGAELGLLKMGNDALSRQIAHLSYGANLANAPPAASAAAAAASSPAQTVLQQQLRDALAEIEKQRAGMEQQRARILELSGELASAQNAWQQQQQHHYQFALSATGVPAFPASGLRDFTREINDAAPLMPAVGDIVSFRESQSDVITRSTRGQLLMMIAAMFGIDARNPSSIADGFKRAYVEVLTDWMTLAAEQARHIAPDVWPTSPLCRLGDRILLLLHIVAKQKNPTSVATQLLKQSADDDDEPTYDTMARKALNAAASSGGGGGGGGGSGKNNRRGNRGGKKKAAKNESSGRGSSNASKSQQH